MTVAENLDKKVVLTVGEGKHLCYSLSYMTRSVKNGFKKSAENKKAYKEKYAKYIDLRNYLIDQLKDYKEKVDSELIEIIIKAENVEMLNEFVRQQINLFSDMLLKNQDDLKKTVHSHIVPLQTIAFKLN